MPDPVPRAHGDLSYGWPDSWIRAARRPRIRRYAPRGWVADLLGRAPQIEACDVLDTWGEDDPAQLTELEAAAVACASYVRSVPAARWDHEIAHPIKRRKGAR